MIEKQAETQVPINQLIASRWSGRAYDARRHVTLIQIRTMLEAGRWAPSCYGDQPWRYIVCNREVDTGAWEKALACLSQGNQTWARNAPVLILVLADTAFSHNDSENRWGGYDTGAASMSLCLQARELGLMTHQMGGFDAARVKEMFGVAERFEAMSVMAVGYQLPVDEVPEDLLEREMKERKRKAFDELFFAGHWGEVLV